MDPIDIKKISIAASQYSVSTLSNTNRDEDRERGRDTNGGRGGRGLSAMRDSDLWVSTADMPDILRLAGVSATSVTIAECVEALKCFLPGVPQGKLCFQVRKRHHFLIHPHPLKSFILFYALLQLNKRDSCFYFNVIVFYSP